MTTSVVQDTPGITRATATQFHGYSAENAATAEDARDCGCEAYRDIFTYKRWKAQGFQVMRGEHGTKAVTRIPITKTDKATGEKVTSGTRPKTYTVFCRCQVEAVTEGATATAPVFQPSPATDRKRAETRKHEWRPVSGAVVADKLRDMAERIQKDIDHKRADRLTNTPKRQCQAARQQQEAGQLERGQQALVALAALHEAGTMPPLLAGYVTKKAVLEATRTQLDTSGGYYDAASDTGVYSDTSEAAVALQALVSGKSEVQQQKERVAALEASVQFSNIPGYFPTPPEVVAVLLDAAEIAPGMSVLEPSAGSGAIADAIRERHGYTVQLDLAEIALPLQAVLRAKGHEVKHRDLFEIPNPPNLGIYDRIVQNPPFEGGQDAAHVMRAYELLKPGGVLVSVMSPGSFQRSDKRAQQFREWFEAMDGEKHDVAPGAFKPSGTNVPTVIVVLRSDNQPEVKP